MSILQPMISVPEPVQSPAPTRRLKSLDVFRGITIAGMLLVNNPGDWGHVYWPLLHAEDLGNWDKCTPTDLIFPFFLFIVGVSTIFSLAKRKSSPDAGKGTLFRHIAIRGVMIILLGLLLHSLPVKREPPAAAGASTQSVETETLRNGFWHPSTIRFPGVLQRIGFCYLIAATIILFTPWPVQLITAIALMVLNGYLMLHVPYGPDGHKAGWTEFDNYAAYIDGKVFGEHNYKREWHTTPAGERVRVYFDPEGLVSSLPAVATILFGGLAGAVLRRNEDQGLKLGALFSLGVIFLIVGWAMRACWMPLNKPLWTPTYAVMMSGMGMLGLGFCYWLIDLKGYWKWSYPFIWFGMNAIAAFVLSGIVNRVLGLVLVTEQQVPVTKFLKDHLNHAITNASTHLSWPWLASLNNLSLAWALCYVIFFAILMWILYALKIFIKV